MFQTERVQTFAFLSLRLSLQPESDPDYGDQVSDYLFSGSADDTLVSDESEPEEEERLS